MVCVMEVKPTQGRRDLSLPLSKFLPDCFPFRRFCLSSWVNSSLWSKKQFRGIVLRWRNQIQEISRGQSSTEYFLVHAVKEGETLTSIAKQYGVSIYSIAAANRNITDLDLVLQGQLLNIPCSTLEEAQVFGTVKRWLCGIKVPQRLEGSLNNTPGLADQNIFTMLTTACGLPRLQKSAMQLKMAILRLNMELVRIETRGLKFRAKSRTAGYLLFLVPVIVLCIKCIMGAFHKKVVGDLKQKMMNRSKGRPLESKSPRWRSALKDLDILDSSQPSSDFYNPLDDDTPFEDMPRNYSKLEEDYQKFLAECGMSERGYWRGGSTGTE